jgi:hypothetical protein
MNAPSVIDHLLTAGYDAVTVPPDHVFTYLRERFGVAVKSREDTLTVPLATLDQAASDAIRQAQIDGAVQGGVLGSGGIITIPMDVLTLISASVRLCQRIAMTYGFGVTSAEEKAAVWTVLAEASGVAETPHSVGQLLLDSMPNVLQQSPYHRVLMFKLVREILIQLVWKEGQRGLRRLFPFAGSVLGAVSNYRFLAQVGRVAKDHYHAAHLRRREMPTSTTDLDLARLESEGNADPDVQEAQQEESREEHHPAEGS